MSIVIIVESQKIPDDVESPEASNVGISSGGSVGGEAGGEIGANGGREKNGSTSNVLAFLK
jgi:hypothetical protein